MNQESISLNEYPSVHWKKFFQLANKTDTIPVEEWNTTNLIGYFCKKYKDYYNLDYTFKFNSTAPTKSYEVFNFRKLSSMLSSEPNILKDYIDWFFQNKIVARKRRITSMAYLTDAITVNEYKFKKLLISKNISIDRSTTLPPNYIEVITGFGQHISNYGELAFIKRCMDNGNATDPKFKEMMDALRKAGLDTNSLDKVK